MTELDCQHVLDTLAAFYVTSGDFNGMPIETLLEHLDVVWTNAVPCLSTLIEQGLAGLLTSEDEVNPHILRTGFPDKNVQLAYLSRSEPPYGCIYPASAHLRQIIDPQPFQGRPFTLELVLGEPQLAFRVFDLSVLESYRNDPRYSYTTNDISGRISVRDEFYESQSMAESDQVLLQTFGFAYDRDWNRAVAVYLRYLSDLSPEHQRIWKAKQLVGNFSLHPDYHRATIVGAWPERIPILDAFVRELYTINSMAATIGRPPLFRQDFGKYGEGKPKGLTLLVRPTLQEFNNFVLLLDKLLSENINLEFFQKEIPYETDTTRSDGKIVVTKKGTLQLLDEWVRATVDLPDWSLWEESMTAFRKVRKLRQKPAHSIDEDVFDQAYLKQQRDLLVAVYGGIRILRLIIALHPKLQAADAQLPGWQEEGRVWVY